MLPFGVPKTADAVQSSKLDHYNQTEIPARVKDIRTDKIASDSPEVLLPVQQQNQFVDPAILSFGLTPSLYDTDTTRKLQKPQVPFIVTDSSVSNVLPSASSQPSAKLTEQLDLLSLQHASPAHSSKGQSAIGDATFVDEDPNNLSKRGKKKPRKHHKKNQKPVNQESSSPELTKATNRQADQANSGWRQTPILEIPQQNIPSVTATKTPGVIGGKIGLLAAQALKRKSRPRNVPKNHPHNEWATEDVTDVQDLGDFDFVSNLSMFDKKTVFDQIRNDDTTADEDRLVAYNRTTRPGTLDGKKLHPTENVLERRRHYSKDVSFESTDEDSDPDGSLDIRQMRKAMSRSSKRQTSRKGSLKLGEQLSRSNTSIGPASQIRSQSVKSPSLRGNDSPAITSKRRPRLRYVKVDKSCPMFLPITLAQAEKLALSDSCQLTTDILAECAARSIAEAVMAAVNPGGRRIGSGNHNSRPVVVIVAGDNEGGARALAAGRHLEERGIEVVASLVGSGLDDSDPLTVSISKQASRLHADLMTWQETSEYLKTLDSPPELIIDAMLGLHHAGTLDLTALEVMAWANKSRASVLAIDIPSGIDPETGAVEVVEGEPAEVRAKIVMCCGAPSTGLGRAMAIRKDENSGFEWRTHVCDIGINSCLRQISARQSGRSSGRSVKFGNDWVVGIDFDAGEE